jgi:glycine/D-amino acid oxidase-like deaminating enzyme
VAKPFDVAIIGLGAMGSAGAAECAARGARVVGFEQFGFAHDRSSSHGESRIFRLAYFEHPDYVPLLRRARELWLSIDLEAEVALFHACGGLWIGEADHPLVAGALQSARLHRLAHELLDGATVAERFAPLRLPPDLVGFYEPDAGAVRPEREVQPHEVDELREGMARILPELRDAPLVRTSVCLYTNTPDGHFVIDVLEEDPRRVIACGFSGHGFKFAPVIGEILADLSLEGETRHRIEFLSRQRFQSPGPD